jgi:hypothetical protein
VRRAREDADGSRRRRAMGGYLGEAEMKRDGEAVAVKLLDLERELGGRLSQV